MGKGYGTSLERIPKHSGYWVDKKSGVIYWRGTIKNKSIKMSTRERQISKAKAFIDDYRLRLTSDNYEKALRKKQGIINPRLSELHAECIAERAPSRAKSTAKRHPAVWRIDLAPFWGDKHASDMTKKNVVDFENWYLATFPGKLFFTARKSLVMLINYMHREGYIDKKPQVTDLDKKVNAGKRKTAYRVYTEDEQAALIQSATFPWVRLGLIAYFDMGVRKEELLRRKWSEISWKKRTIEVWSQKNKRWRTVPLTDRLYEMFQAFAEVSETEHIFPKKNSDRPLAGQQFDTEWRATKRAAGIKGKARIHDIRHTFATVTARDGWPIPVACKALDMTADEYIKTYVHITPDDIAAHLRRSFG